MGTLYAVTCVMLHVQDLIPIQHTSGELNIKRWVHHTYQCLLDLNLEPYSRNQKKKKITTKCRSPVIHLRNFFYENMELSFHCIQNKISSFSF